ncbi:MAG: hypothetical protein AAF740_06900, partial [Bacteroidota bacterium]
YSVEYSALDEVFNDRQMLEISRRYVVTSGGDSPAWGYPEIAKYAFAVQEWGLYLHTQMDIFQANIDNVFAEDDWIIHDLEYAHHHLFREEREQDSMYVWEGDTIRYTEDMIEEWTNREIKIEREIKEECQNLRKLGLRLEDFLFGIALRVHTDNEAHYFGQIIALSKLLSMCEQKDLIETRLTQMIADPELDHYNRLLMFHLFGQYNDHLFDQKRQARNTKRIQELEANLPEILKNSLDGFPWY